MAAFKSVSRSTLKEVQTALPRQIKYTTGLKKAVQRKVEDAQKKLLEEFERHPVTVEISGGTNATNLSGTLSGHGNLFSYIGFSSGDKPLSTIREMLKKYEIRYHHTKVKTVINITVPTKEEIFRSTPLPWATGRSWAKGIETGISGLGKYLHVDSPRSRSGKGIQTKGRQRAGQFNNTSYLSSLLNDYYKEIRKIERSSLS
jgi:hypothetical protein